MHGDPLVEREKVRAVIRDECVVLFHNELHQFPIRGTAETAIIDVVGNLIRRMC